MFALVIHRLRALKFKFYFNSFFFSGDQLESLSITPLSLYILLVFLYFPLINEKNCFLFTKQKCESEAISINV